MEGAALVVGGEEGLKEVLGSPLIEGTSEGLVDVLG